MAAAVLSLDDVLAEFVCPVSLGGILSRAVRGGLWRGGVVRRETGWRVEALEQSM